MEGLCRPSQILALILLDIRVFFLVNRKIIEIGASLNLHLDKVFWPKNVTLPVEKA